MTIGNAWHIPGGEGWCANSANLRVLVTKRDGSQSVEMIEDDLGLDSSDSQQVLAKLRRQGVDAIDVESARNAVKHHARIHVVARAPSE